MNVLTISFVEGADVNQSNKQGLAVVFLNLFSLKRHHQSFTNWKVHAVNVLSSLSLFRVLHTELHTRQVGQHPTHAVFGQNRSNSQFRLCETVFQVSKTILRLLTNFFGKKIVLLVGKIFLLKK